MKIAIFDIDDTIVEETEFMLKNAPEFLLKQYKIDVEMKNPNGYDLIEVYNLEEHLKQSGYDEVSAKEKSHQINQAFWNKNFVKYCKQPIKPGVKETVEMFQRKGYRVFFLSLRGKKSKMTASPFEDNIRSFIVAFLTASQLSRVGIPYDAIKLVRSKQEKIKFINAMNPDFVFEDQPDVINSISSKTTVFCMNVSHNQDAMLNKPAIRFEKFQPQEIERIVNCVLAQECTKRQSHILKSIKKGKKINNPLYLRKFFTEWAYWIVKVIGTPFLCCLYHPIVKGKRNIPSHGAVVFAGNHRNKLDPVVVGATSNRSIHWGALLRMFQGKENLFSPGKNPIPCHLSAAFITAVGAVPIARDTDKNYLRINLESIRSLYQFLEWNGAVGLFPEGTLNRKPDEQNILPLKSDRVFKMASDMDGIIQPFSIVWIPKEVGINRRVIVNYGFPINCRNRSSEEVFDLWHDEVNLCIEDAKRLFERIKGINEKTERNQKVKSLLKEYINM